MSSRCATCGRAYRGDCNHGMTGAEKQAILDGPPDTPERTPLSEQLREHLRALHDCHDLPPSDARLVSEVAALEQERKRAHNEAAHLWGEVSRAVAVLVEPNGTRRTRDIEAERILTEAGIDRGTPDYAAEVEHLRAAVDKIETNMRRVIEQSKQPHATGSIFNTAVEAWANEIRALTTEGENDE